MKIKMLIVIALCSGLLGYSWRIRHHLNSMRNDDIFVQESIGEPGNVLLDINAVSTILSWDEADSLGDILKLSAQRAKVIGEKRKGPEK